MRVLFLFALTSLLSGQALAATLEVGPDKTFKTLAAAVAASKAHDTIHIAGGTYTNDFTRVRHPLTVKAPGKPARLDASGLIPNGKAIIIVDASLSIQNLIFSNASVRDKNGAGIRHQKGALVVEDCIFESNENGILGGASKDASIIIRNSFFAGNGYGDGYSHGIYVGKIASLTVQNSRFRDTRIGHHIKSRAMSTKVIQSLLDDGTARSSYSIDLPNGGTNVIRGNTFIQNKTPDNDIFISIGTKSVHSSSSLIVEGNQFHNFASSGTAVRNAMDSPVQVLNNSFFGPLRIIKGRGKLEGNLAFEGLPQTSHALESWQEEPR